MSTSTSPTPAEDTKSATLLELLAAAPALAPDPRAGHRLLDISSQVLNRLMRENVTQGSTRSAQAVADANTVVVPDNDADLRRLAFGLVMEEPLNYPELKFTDAQMRYLREMQDTIRGLLTKQFKGDRKPETKKIYETLRAIV